MVKNQYGFSTLIIVASVAAVLIVGAVGWQVHSAKSSSVKPVTKTTTTKQSTPKSGSSTSTSAGTSTPAADQSKPDSTPTPTPGFMLTALNTTTTTTFGWTKVTGATSYELCWSGYSSGCSTVYGADALQGGPQQSLALGKYYSAHVTANDSNHSVSNTISWQQGATNATDTVLTLTLASHTSSWATFSWNAIKGAIQYTVCWTGDGTGCTTVTGTSAATPAESPLFAGDHYSAKVTADDPNHTVSNTVSWEELAPVY